MIFSKVARYLKYMLFSHHRRGHGIHSPFVFDLVSRVFRNKIDPEIILKVEQVRRKMITDKRTIPVLDLGSGSRIVKSTLGRVSEIASLSPVPAKYGVFLSRMAAEFGNPEIIELGTSIGISTMYLSMSSPESKIYTIEGSPAIAEIARQNFHGSGLNNITVLEGPFDDVLPRLLSDRIVPGLVYIDGNHRKEPVIRYFNQVAEAADKNTVIIIDDINYSNEMSEAWEQIKLNEKVSISIDIFRMGICFFRDMINHNNYTIRY